MCHERWALHVVIKQKFLYILSVNDWKLDSRIQMKWQNISKSWSLLILNSRNTRLSKFANWTGVDSIMTFKPQISSCFYHLRRMKSSLKLLSFDIARTVVNSFVISSIDYCNSLLANSSQPALNRLQRVMNAAVWLVCHSGLLRDRLHWLRVPERVGYKLCLLVFKAVHGTAPEYLSELCRSNAEDNAPSRLRSAAHGDLQVPRSKTNFCDRAFAVAGPASWNSLSATIRSSHTLQNFKNKLKAHFFHGRCTRPSAIAPSPLPRQRFGMRCRRRSRRCCRWGHSSVHW